MDKETKKYLGIDWGEKRIGLAIGDDDTKMATPFKVVGSADDVLDYLKEEETDMIVIGMPVKMSGAVNETSAAFDGFVEYLRDKAGIPIEFMDERLTSKAADALPGTKKDKAPRDAVAAMLILQSFLDRLDDL